MNLTFPCFHFRYMLIFLSLPDALNKSIWTSRRWKNEKKYMDCLRIKFRSVIKILSTYFYFFEMMEAFRGTKVFNHSSYSWKSLCGSFGLNFFHLSLWRNFFPPSCHWLLNTSKTLTICQVVCQTSAVSEKKEGPKGDNMTFLTQFKSYIKTLFLLFKRRHATKGTFLHARAETACNQEKIFWQGR